MNIKKDTLKQSVLNVLKEKGPSPLGELVKELSYPYQDILDTVIDLKNEGIVKKDITPPGYFSLKTMA